MANPEHLSILKQGVVAWAEWRAANPGLSPNLEVADLRRITLRGANLAQAWLVGADLSGVDLGDADLRWAVLVEANLTGADLRRAKLYYTSSIAATFDGADLRSATLKMNSFINSSFVGADLNGADLRASLLTGVDLRDADLRGANLQGANLVAVDLTGARLDGCLVHGTAAWNVKLPAARSQSGLIITQTDEPTVTVDNLEVAQFVHLLLQNQKLGSVIDAIGRKGVLILGRFYEERKAVLDGLKKRLRDFDLVPMVFDFDKPSRRDLTETVQLLANMSRFVIADVTDAKSIPQELSHIIPFFPSVPVRPIILEGEYEFSMFEHWESFDSVLDVYRYKDRDELIANIEFEIIGPVLKWEEGFDQQKALQEKAKALEEENRTLQAKLYELRAKLGIKNDG